jgi:anti-sigma factor RsiW
VTPNRPPLSCRECADFLLDYTSGELPDAVRREFERHLAACPPCVTYLDTYRTTVALEKPALCGRPGAKPAEMPEALVRAILAAREAGAQAPPPARSKRRRT